jgi:hypothetical protein
VADKVLRFFAAITLTLVAVAAIEHLTYMRVAVVNRHKLESSRWREALAHVETRCSEVEAEFAEVRREYEIIHDWRVRVTLEARKRGWPLTGTRYGSNQQVADE